MMQKRKDVLNSTNNHGKHCATLPVFSCIVGMHEKCTSWLARTLMLVFIR